MEKKRKALIFNMKI